MRCPDELHIHPAGPSGADVLGHGRLGEIRQVDRTVSLLDREPTMAGEVVNRSRHPADRTPGGVDVPGCSRLVPGLDGGQLEIRPHDGERSAQLVNHFLHPAATLDLGDLHFRSGLRHNPSHATGHHPGDNERRDQGQSRRQQTGVDEPVARPFLGDNHDRQVVTDLGNPGPGIRPWLLTHEERDGHHHHDQCQEQGRCHEDDRQSNPGSAHASAFNM